MKRLLTILILAAACDGGSHDIAPPEFCHEQALAACTLNASCGEYDSGYIEDCVATLTGLLACDMWDQTYCADSWQGWTPGAAEECLSDIDAQVCGEDQPESCSYSNLCGGLKEE